MLDYFCSMSFLCMDSYGVCLTTFVTQSRRAQRRWPLRAAQFGAPFSLFTFHSYPQKSKNEKLTRSKRST